MMEADTGAGPVTTVLADEHHHHRGWEMNKANSLRFRHHHGRYHDSTHSHSMLAKNNRKQVVPPDHEQACCSISNDHLHNQAMVDSIEILPIFHKLLEDKRSSDCAFSNAASSNGGQYDKEAAAVTAAGAGTKPKSRFHSARSCPDMSVRCDIVEYL